MLASTWFDLVIGVDLHFELVPPPMLPAPFPHPFVGLVFDPIGLAAGLAISNAIGMAFGGSFKGPVLINLLPANTTGTEAKNTFVLPHFIIPPGTMWAPMMRAPKPTVIPGKVPTPELPIPPPGDAVMITGSKTVHAMGANLCRLGDLALSCSDPIRLPSSAVLAIPKGLPVLVGGPPALDWMAAALGSLKTKWVSNKLHNVVNKIKNARVRNILNKGVCFLTGHPVDVATGRVLTEGLDLELPGPLELVIERNYASSWAHRDSPVGFGWSHSLDQAVWIERGRVVYRAADGREIEFDTFDLPDRVMRPGDSIFEPMNRLTLRSLGRYRWEVETASGTVHEFAPLPGDKDPTMARLIRRRTRQHHEITLHYDAHARLEWAHDVGGRIVRFAHDSAGKLSQVSIPHPSQPGWVPHTQYKYSAEGDLTEAIDPLGNVTTYRYVDHLLVQETDRTGLSFYFGYDGTGPGAYCIRTWGDGGIYDHEIDYDRSGRVTYVTNSLGATTTYEMNVANAVVRVIDPCGGETRYEYDDDLRKTAQTDALGSATRFAYDARGNCVKITRADSSSIEIEYSAQNLPIRSRDSRGSVQTWRYDELGQLLERVDPLGQATRFEHTNGQISSVIDPSGARTSISYDDAKCARSVRTPDGGEIVVTRDLLGRVLERRDKRGAIQRRHYDAAGHVVTVEEPTGNVRRFAYDGEGNLLETQDHFKRVRYKYEGFHRLVLREEVDANVRFSYDTEGQLLTIENELGEVAEFARDRCGRVQRERGFDGLETRYVLNAAGRVSEVHKPSGARTLRAYDAVGRTTRLTHSDGTEERYAYGEDGLLSAVENDATSVRFERDGIGRVVREWQGENWIASRYSGSGHRVQVTSSMGATIDMERTVLGDLLSLTAGGGASPWSVEFERDATGLETERRLPGGTSVRRRYDLVGRPIEQRVVQGGAELGQTTYTWAMDGRLVARTDTIQGETRFQHDARRRLTAALHTERGAELRVPDAGGRVYRSETGADRRYLPGGSIKEADGIQHVYDVDGNLIEKVTPDGSRWRFTYYGSGLLKSVVRPDGSAVTFHYDGLGRRVRKDVAGTMTKWVWNGNELLHEMADAGAPVTWLFSAPGYEPVGMLQGPSRHGFVSDQSGAPTELYDEAGAVAWRGRIDLFGVVRPDVARAPCPLRWPGQYEDKETGLYYNRFRYYDPQTGRYISQDPIGFLGGLDAYGYTTDPLTMVDPFGLDAHHTIPRALMAALVDAELMPQSIFDELNPIARGTNVPLQDLPRGAANGKSHSSVHKALNDFLKSDNKYPGITELGGWGSEAGWKDYLDQVSGEDRLDTVLKDMREFYHEHLPTTDALDGLGDRADDTLKGLQDSVDDDARRIRKASPKKKPKSCS